MPQSHKSTHAIFHSKHRIISASKMEFELLHHVTLDELKALAKNLPGLIIRDIIQYDSKNHPNQPFKIIIGEGKFSRVRLAKQTDANGNVTYYAQRKILSQKMLNDKHKDSKNHFERHKVLADTEKELHILEKIAKRNIFGTPLYFTKKEHNKKNEHQIYQFCKIASFKDLTHLDKFYEHAGLNDCTEDKYAVIECLVNKMIKAIIELHELNIKHRDIKPANFLLTRDGNVLIADFGSIAFRKPDKTWETASLLTDKSYLLPRFLVDRIKGTSKQLSIQDAWALAISILELYGIDNISKKNAAVATKAYNDETAITDAYKLIADTKLHPAYKKIPTYIQHYIDNAFDMNPKINDEISKMIDTSNTNTKGDDILQKALITACDKIDALNAEYFSEMETKMLHSSLASSDTNHSMDSDQSLTYSVDDMGGYVLPQDASSISSNSQDKKSDTDSTFFEPTTKSHSTRKNDKENETGQETQEPEQNPRLSKD